MEVHAERLRHIFIVEKFALEAITYHVSRKYLWAFMKIQFRPESPCRDMSQPSLDLSKFAAVLRFRPLTARWARMETATIHGSLHEVLWFNPFGSGPTKDGREEILPL